MDKSPDAEIFGFRTEIVIADKVRLGVDRPELVVYEEGRRRVWLRGASLESSLGDTKEIVLRGTGYVDKQSAELDAVLWRQVIQRAFVRLRICADFGSGRVSEAKRMNFAIGDFDPADRAGAVYLQEDGIQIFPDDGKVLFVEFSAQAAMVIPADRIVDTVKAYAVSRHLSSPRVQKASELYGDAAFQASPMSQIVMLTAAVEALSEKQRRSDAECTLIDEMILMVDEADVEIESGERLKNALRGLKDESVRAAAKRICSTLDQEYNSMSPKKYFDHAYNVRSSLAHGGSGFDRTIVGGTASVLEVFVSDLISSVSAHEAPD